MRRLNGLALAAVACASHFAGAQTVTKFPEAPTIDLVGDSARRAFVPVLPAVDSGGECRVYRYPNGTSGMTVYFPSEAAKEVTLFATFDKAGKIQSFSENRGRPWKFVPPPNATPEQLYDAGMKFFLSLRQTMISLDFRRDSASATNSAGDGTPRVRIKGTVKELEDLVNLGPPKERLIRLRKICGA